MLDWRHFRIGAAMLWWRVELVRVDVEKLFLHLARLMQREEIILAICAVRRKSCQPVNHTINAG